MLKILIATHGDLSAALKSSVELICGGSDNIEVMSLYHDTNIEEFTASIHQTIQSLTSQDHSVLAFVDIYGASPFKACALASKNILSKQYRIISGVNLPMVIEAVMFANNKLLSELYESVLETGKESIKEFFTELKLT